MPSDSGGPGQGLPDVGLRSTLGDSYHMADWRKLGLAERAPLENGESSVIPDSARTWALLIFLTDSATRLYTVC